MSKLNNKFTFGYLKCAKNRKRSAITSRYISKVQEFKLVTPSTVYWFNCISIPWAYLNRIGKIQPLGLMWYKNNSYTGGCTTRSCEWPDPPLGPPLNFIIEVTSSYIYRTN